MDSEAGQRTSLEDYVARMQGDQDAIWYITAEGLAAAANSPHLEVFRKKGIEVLLLSDRIDEWLVAHMTEFDGKQLQSVARGDLDLGAIGDEEEQKASEEANKAFEDVIERVKKTLGDPISDARMSQRLTDSPSCLVLNEQDMSIQMQQILEAAGQYAPKAQPVLELNSDHKLVAKLKDIEADDSFEDWISLLFEQAQLAAGQQLEDPAGFVMRVNRLLES